MIEKNFDERRTVIIPGNEQETLLFCAKQFVAIGKKAILETGHFTVALSGGSTPQALFKLLSEHPFSLALDWSKVLFFWSDERSVPPNNSESNYFNAMQSGLSKLPILSNHIFRMHSEENIEGNARAYEIIIRQMIPTQEFDLLMLGMGEDGHTASLFPQTLGLHDAEHLVIANYIPQKHTWRMSFTYTCIHKAKNVCIYVLGKNKANMVAKVLLGDYDPDNLPVQKVGTPSHKAMWILDEDAAAQIKSNCINRLPA